METKQSSMRIVMNAGEKKVIALDQRGEGNANHEYIVAHAGKEPRDAICVINFQNGPVGEKGVNGVQNEDLLAVVIDRLAGFQAGKFRCQQNGIALVKIQEALFWLANRTAMRTARGVEGKNVV